MNLEQFVDDQKGYTHGIAPMTILQWPINTAIHVDGI